jgi:hypothetical protein
MHKYRISIEGSSPDQKRHLSVQISTANFLDNIISESPYAQTIQVGHEKEMRVAVYEDRTRIALITVMGGMKPYSLEDGCLSVALQLPVPFKLEPIEEEAAEAAEAAEAQYLEDLKAEEESKMYDRLYDEENPPDGT